MKLWDVVKGEGLNATYNLCGYSVYKIVEKQNLRERKFCHGLISSKKTVDYSKGIYLREVFICGLCISQRGIYNYKLFLKFFGITLRNEDVSIAFYKKYKSKIPADTDYIFFLTTGIGEFSLFLSLCLNNFMKLNNIKCPLFITQVKSHIELLKIFCPTLKIVSIPKAKFPRWAMEKESKINNIRARYLFPVSYFQRVEENIKTKKSHFFEFILEYFKLNPNNFLVNLPKIEDKSKYTAEEKLKSIGMSDKKFVFIVPDANSCIRIKGEFWNKLVKKLHKKGVEVVFNSVKAKNASGHFTSFSLQEAFFVAKKAKAVIGVRSGLLDFLSMAGTPIHVIYTAFGRRVDFPPMSKEDVKIGFDLEKIPAEIRKSQIYSYLYSDKSVDNILKNL